MPVPQVDSPATLRGTSATPDIAFSLSLSPATRQLLNPLEPLPSFGPTENKALYAAKKEKEIIKTLEDGMNSHVHGSAELIV
jgi:hypothetical protein